MNIHSPMTQKRARCPDCKCFWFVHDGYGCADFKCKCKLTKKFLEEYIEAGGK